MLRTRQTGLLAAVAVWAAGGAGCLLRGSDPRPLVIPDVPPIPADARSSDVVQTPATPPRPPADAAPGKADARPNQLNVPPELPGSDAPAVAPLKGGPTAGQFPTLSPVEADAPPAPSPTGHPLTLSELEQTALANNPTIRQAAADVEAARGRMVQAGLPPNPSAGYQADQIGSGTGYPSRGQQGGYFGFTIKTAGKLRVARQAGLMDLANSQIALRRAQLDLINQVRTNYFALLVARESLTVNRALARFTEDIYRAQISLVRGGEQAAYEPLQSYVLAVQARGTVVQARNRSVSAWKQLAAALGRPDLPPTEVAGRADAPAPTYYYEQLREMMLAHHTDLQTAQNTIQQGQYNLRLADVTPIPDIVTQIYIEKDWSTPPFNTQVGVQSGGAIPVFDRNQGNRAAARATLARAIQDVPRIQNDLSSRLAVAFEAYENARVLTVFYREQAVPNLVRVYRAVYQRYMQDPARVSYNDVVTAQQNLANGLATYLTTLGQQWTAVADLANLAQTDELYLPTPTADGPGVDGVLTGQPQPHPAGPAQPPAPGPQPAKEPADKGKGEGPPPATVVPIPGANPMPPGHAPLSGGSGTVVPITPPAPPPKKR